MLLHGLKDAVQLLGESGAVERDVSTGASSSSSSSSSSEANRKASAETSNAAPGDVVQNDAKIVMTVRHKK